MPLRRTLACPRGVPSSVKSISLPGVSWSLRSTSKLVIAGVERDCAWASCGAALMKQVVNNGMNVARTRFIDCMTLPFGEAAVITINGGARLLGRNDTGCQGRTRTTSRAIATRRPLRSRTPSRLHRARNATLRSVSSSIRVPQRTSFPATIDHFTCVRGQAQAAVRIDSRRITLP